MKIPFVLYRLLCPWITCEFYLQNKNNSKIALNNRYEVFSFKDVFCHPFYWQVFQWVNRSPKLVIDCGAHCGHFSILADICFESKFGTLDTEYILVEPNPYLLPIIKKNLSDARLTNRVELKQGLLKEKSGSGTLWVKPNRYLETNMEKSKGAKPFNIPFIDLQELVGDRVIDLMKIDIEGGEFAFVRSHLDLFKQVQLIFMELHHAPKEIHQELFDSLKSVGLHLASEPLKHYGHQLVIFHRQ